ncbi:hypothetical protein MXB_342 [Myxobolus squamalis]|nr:hypothetical protein MXB_342 [Myxobolus squamalis]
MSYYTRPTLHNHRTENMILLESEDLVVDDDGDEYYSEDEIDGASDGDDEYAVVSDVSDFNDEDAYPEEESLPSNPNPNFSDDDYPTVVDSNYHSNPSSESDQNTHDDTHNRFSLFYEPVSRLHDPSPFNILHRNELRPRSSNRNRSLPPNYQWAIRNGSNSDSARDSLSVIRSSTCDSSLNDTYLMISLQSGLARSFMLIVKIISDLCAYKGIFKNDIVTEIFNSTLGQVFLWMFDICESTEAKLRFGMQSLNSMVPSLQPGRWDYDVVYGSPENNSDGNSSTARSRRRSDDRNNLTNSQKNRNDFLGNLISILRSNDNDHFGILPYLDLTAFKHIAYMLDGFIYFLYSSSTERSENDLQTFSSRLSLIYNANDFEFVCKKFFSRTLSTLTYGYQSSDLSSSITDSLPLAVYPSILTSLSSKKDLFGSNKLLKDVDSPILQAPFNLLSTKLFTTTDRHSFISTILKLPPIDYIMRWNNLIDVFSQIFSDSIGVEASTIYQQFSRFEAKEFAFRLYIERIKSVASNELALVNLERINSKIILQTFKILNTYFSKRQTNVPCLIPPFSRIKALFKNEPGEGSGVTRNFFAFICQAITSSDKLPDLSSAFETGVNTVSSDSHTRNVGGLYFDDPSNTSSLPGVERLLNRLNRLHGPRGRGDSSWSNLILQSSINRQPVNSVHRTRRNISQVEESITLNQIESMNRDPESANSKQLETRLSLLLKKKLTLVAPELVNEVVEALLQLSPDVLFSCLNDEEYLKSRVTLILKLYGDLKLNTGKSKDTFEFSFDASVLPEDTCLFFQPGKPGFYFPTNAKKSLTRLNAYKNVGRIIGMAFYFNEVIPLVLCRPVIKFFLGHPLSFHDFAFYDPVQYESLRMLTLEAEKFSRDNPDQEVPLHGLNFCLNVVDSDENPHTIDLMPSGSNIPVTSKNVNKYVQAYVEYLILFSVKPELTAIRDGIHEVLHPYILQSLNSEDFRLLLNGSFEVLVSSLKKIVAFTDEASGLSPEKMERFQNWFWSVVESLNPTQRGELLQFWTSSPLLSEIETTPKPNITIKPCSNHLPTSNTCVMRLYLPAYKKKSVLKSKLLLAIKTRTFGFI